MATERPNILWLMTDEQRCDSLGCYGAEWAHTPNIDALAREGAVFGAAVTPAPVCVPARTSILAGKYPCRTGVWHNSIDLKAPVPNLMGRFRDAGYLTASFGKQHYGGRGSAFDTESGPCLSEHVHYFRYPEQYDESRHDVVKYPGDIYNWIFGGRFPAPAEETAEAQVVGKATEWLDAEGRSCPLFLRVSFNGPHTPVVPPEPFDRIVDADAVKLPAEAEEMPEGSPRWLDEELSKCASAAPLSGEQIRKMRGYYYGEVAFLDSLFGRLLDGMRERGLLDNTIVVYCSDHGTHLGDFGLVQKQTFFEPVVNVPFIWWYPSGIAGGARFRTPVETQSMLPTLLELAGLEAPGAGYSPSLASCLSNGREPEQRPVFSEFTLASFAPHTKHDRPLVMVRDGEWKLSGCFDSDVSDLVLYDLERDPHERRNLAEDPASRQQRDRLLALVSAHLQGESTNVGVT